jgi:acyl-ACP thioesterase
VQASDCQSTFTANVPALQRWLQNAAAQHAEALGVGIQALQHQGLTWILSRISLSIIRAPVCGKTVRLLTWPSGVRGKLVAERQFYLETLDGEPLLKGSSEWLCVNLTTGRLAPLPEAVKALASPTTHTFRLCQNKLPTPAADKTPLHTLDLQVRRQQIDANRHVNNVHYSEWAHETLPETFYFNQQPIAFDIEFKAAAKLGDAITSVTFELQPNIFYHQILTHDGTLLARATTVYPSTID